MWRTKIIYLARELLEPSGPTPTISQSTATIGVTSLLSPFGSGLADSFPCRGASPLRCLSLWVPAPISFFICAQFELTEVPAKESSLGYKPLGHDIWCREKIAWYRDQVHCSFRPYGIPMLPIPLRSSRYPCIKLSQVCSWILCRHILGSRE